VPGLKCRGLATSGNLPNGLFRSGYGTTSLDTLKNAPTSAGRRRDFTACDGFPLSRLDECRHPGWKNAFNNSYQCSNCNGSVLPAAKRPVSGQCQIRRYQGRSRDYYLTLGRQKHRQQEYGHASEGCSMSEI
jgi:hypothetical protein